MASETFDYTGSEQTWTVPDDVEKITVECWGAEGGNAQSDHGESGNGDAGAYAKSVDVSVTPGETIYVYVGGSGQYGGDGGAGGWNGGGDGGSDDSTATAGGGGGGSDIRQGGNTLSDRVAIAGGGGGGGASGSSYGDGGNGGYGDDTGQRGQNGVNTYDGDEADGGEGGNDNSGGAGGTGGNDGDNGSLGVGGNGAPADNGGGGGGGAGGYYGGGGGAGQHQVGGGGGGGSSLANDTESGDNNLGDGQVTISYTEKPASPNNVSQTVQSDDQIDVSWDADTSAGTPDHYDIEISRDGTNWVSPTGGPSTVNHDGSSSYTATYNPANDNAFDTQVGVDSTFRWRVRAENSGGASSWNYSSTKNTTPVPPHKPSASRPGANSIDHAWTVVSDIDNGVEIQYREDTGSGYGSWSTLTTTGAGATGYSETGLSNDIRRQYRYRTVASDGKTSDWAYSDYGNSGNVYFSDDFESGDFSAWSSTSTGNSVGVTSNSYSADNIGGADEGTYYARLDDTDYVYKELGDLSAESNVIVKCAMAAGSLDDNTEQAYLGWYDGSSWQELKALNWSYNKQGWREVTALVPSSYLSTDSRVIIRGVNNDGSDDHSYFDRVVVADILDEYTTPAAPSSLSLDTSVEDEITVSWTINTAFTSNNVQADNRRTSSSSWSTASLAGGTTSNTFTGLDDGEEYEYRIRDSYDQYRNGSFSTTFWSAYTSVVSGITVLPAPSSVSSPGSTSTSVDIEWTVNHDYGEQRVDYKRSSDSTWETFSSGLSLSTNSETITGLLNGEEYDVRIVAKTEHTETVDST